MKSKLLTYRPGYIAPTNQQRVSRWAQRLYKVLQTRDSRDADILFRSFTAMATPKERQQLKTAYEVIKTAFISAYDEAKTVTDKIPTPETTPAVRYDSSRWKGDYMAYRQYAKDTAWLESQFEVV